MKYSSELKFDYQGNKYSDYRKQQAFKYIQNLNASVIEKAVLFKKAGYSITSYKSYAHPLEGVVIYKISYKGKSLVYATDKETYFGGDKKLASFARDCDLLIHDTQYTTEDYLTPHAPKQGFGHSTFDMALECQDYCHAKKVIFYHYDPTYDDDKLNSIAKVYGDLADKADFAYEGLEINI